MKKHLKVVVDGHRIYESYNSKEKVWKYYFDKEFSFGVLDRFSFDDLYIMYYNEYFCTVSH